MNTVEELIVVISKIDGSAFQPVDEVWIADVEKDYPGVPEDLKALYRKLGYGCIGESRYMIHVLMEPSEIYDDDTASSLEGIFIVGDDFAGNCEAYDAKHGWIFGSIGSDGQFEEYGEKYPSLVGFLIDWYSDKS